MKKRLRVIILYKKVIQWKISGIVLCIAIILYYLESRIFKNVMLDRKYDILPPLTIVANVLIITMLTIFLLMIYGTILQEYKSKNRDLLFWTGISKNEEILFWSICLFPWFVIGNQLFSFLLKTVYGYSSITYIFWNAIILVICGVMIVYDIDAFIDKRCKVKNSSEFINSFLDRLSIVLSERIRNTKYVIMQSTIILLCIFGVLFPKGQMRIIYFQGILLLTIGNEDFYWVDKLKSFSLYRLCGIPFYHFYFSELKAALIVSGIPIVLIGGVILSFRELSVVILSVVCALFYWVCIYIYLGLLLRNSLGVKNIMCFFFMMIMCLPVVNMGVYYHILKKTERMWENNDIY